MSKWKKVKLGDYCEITSSKRCLASVRSKNGIPFFCSKEIICLDKGEDFEPTDFIPEELYNDIKAKYGVPTSGDLLLTTRGTNGIPYIYKPSDKFYFADGNLSWFKNFGKELSPQYLYYWFKSPLGIHEVDAISKGTAQKAVPIDGLRRIVLLTPSLHTQNRIVVILSRYDSLIENYQKQIKLLEETAQRLYKEWFIDLHFPGHENTNIIDGVPEGWEKKKVNSIIELQSGFAFKSSTFDDNGAYKVVTIKNVKDGAFDGDNVSKIVAIPDKMPKHCILADGDILLSLTGNVGRVCIVNGKNYLLNQRVAKLATGFKAFTYCLFRSRDMFVEINNLANGAAQQNVSPIRIGEMKILLPNSELLQEFESIVFKSIARIISLQSQLCLLTEARDRLLPKLMSGEIEVLNEK